MNPAARFSRRTEYLLGSACILLACGVSCSSPPATGLDVVLASTVAAPERAPYRLAFAGVEAALAVDASARPLGLASNPVPLDVSEVDRGVLQAIKSSKAFEQESVIPLARGESRSAWEEAFRHRADLVLELRVRRHNVIFHGWHSQHLRFWELTLDFLFAFPQWWIANEAFSADVEVEARLLSVGTRERIWSQVYHSRNLERSRLSHLSRGLVWWWLDSFVVPDRFGPENFARAGQHVFPHAWSNILARLAQALADQPFRAQEGKLAKTLVLAIGVGEQGHRLPDLDVPNKDASRLSRTLRELGGVPPEHIIELTGPSATRTAILSALQSLISHLTPRDALVVYYAGYGRADKESAALVPYDFDPGRPDATGIALADVAQALDGAAGTHLVILDTSFAGEEASSRTVPASLEGGSGAASLPRDAFVSALNRLSHGRTVLLASRPDEAVGRQSFDPEDKAGLFTARLLGAASLKTLDQNGDGWLDFSEVFEQARRDTEELSSLVGHSQHPTQWGVPTSIRFVRLAESTP